MPTTIAATALLLGFHLVRLAGNQSWRGEMLAEKRNLKACSKAPTDKERAEIVRGWRGAVSQ
jgi:hypothetical protein